MKKSVQKQQNTFSKKTAEKGTVPCGQNNRGSRRGHFAPDFPVNLKKVLRSYRKLEHGTYGKVDTLCLGGQKVYYATTDVERVLGFKNAGRFTSRNFKNLGVQVLPIPHPGNAERVQYKNFVSEEGLRKMLNAKRRAVKRTKKDHQLSKEWGALCGWLFESVPGKACIEVRCKAADSVVLKVD